MNILIIPLEKLGLIAIVLFIILKRMSYKKILDFFKKTWKEFLFIVMFSLLFLPFLQSFGVIDDWNQFICARAFLSHSEKLFSFCPSYGYTYPSLVYFFFLLFGTSQISLIFFHFLVFLLTLFFLFLSSYFLFRNKFFALFSLLLLTSFLYYLRGSFVYRNRNIIAILFIFTTMAFISYGIKKKDKVIFLLSLPSLFLGIGVKYELLNLIYPIILLYFYVFKQDLKNSFFLFLVFLTITVFLNFHTFTYIGSFYSPHFRREPSFFYREKVENWIVKNTDKLIKTFLGPNFSLGFLPKNVSAFSFHLRNQPILFLLIGISSVFALIKKKYLEFFVPFSFFVFLLVIFLLYYVRMHEMFFALVISPMFVLSGYLFEVSKIIKQKRFSILILLFLIILFVYEFVDNYFSFSNLFRAYSDNPYYRIQDEKYSKLVKKYINKNSTLIVGHEQVQLNFKFYLPEYYILSLYKLMNDTQIISYYKDKKPLSFYCVELNNTNIYLFTSQIDPGPVKESFKCLLKKYNHSIIYKDDISTLIRLVS